MSWVYRNLLRPCLFTQNPEEIHEFTIHALGRVSRSEWLCETLGSFLGAPELPVEAMGLRFPNPVGLAAGMDKGADAVPAWEAMGFGFTELGAVTWHGQPGNEKPRVFRAIPERAIVNRMGFNNAGAEAVSETLRGWKEKGRWPEHPVGMNLGKSKVTPLSEAAGEYAKTLGVLLPLLDFFVVNVSSPNTPNLRELQDKAALDEILAAMNEVREEAGRAGTNAGTRKPILVKVAPDLSYEALDQILELVGPRNVDGLVATNTTISRPPTDDERVTRVYAETGGLSGRPLRERSTEVIRHLHKQTRGSLPIIGVGGIFTAEDAWEKIVAGACLVQVYTGMVYEGPGIARQIVTGLLERMSTAGMSELRQAVGRK
jgi:dihydroorotate dehydrogenase